jgi:hypothetical protein
MGGPLEGVHKVNRDVAIDNHKGQIGVGILVRDNAGCVIAARSFIKEITTKPVVAKAMGALDAVEFCTHVGLLHIFLEGDALQVDNTVRSTGQSWIRFGQIIEDIRGVLSLLSSWQISHVKIECNPATHRLAKEAVQRFLDETWREVIPHCIYDTVMLEEKKNVLRI